MKAETQKVVFLPDFAIQGYFEVACPDILTSFTFSINCDKISPPKLVI